MRATILCILKLVLKISFKLILDVFYKSFRIVAIFAKEDFKFFSRLNNILLFFLSMSAFILCLAIANTILKKKNHKRGAIVIIGSSRIEMVFVLLTKSITI